MEAGHAVVEEALLAPDEGLWEDDGSADYSGWFCVRTDPFPCPAEGCTFVAVFMTAAHLILVWEQRDDPNLLHHAQRAKEVGRNPQDRRVRRVVRAQRVVLRVGGGRRPRARRSRQVIEQHFGAALTVGVEEELWILDADTLDLTPGVEVLVEGAEARDLPGKLKTELHASVVELATDTSETAGGGGRARHGAASRGRRDRGGERTARRRSRLVSDRDPRRAGDRAGRPLPGLRRVRGTVCAPAGRQRAARPRRDARRGQLPSRDGDDPAVAAARARSFGELAVPRRPRDGDVVDREPRCSACCHAAARRRRSATTRSGRDSSSA